MRRLGSNAIKSLMLAAFLSTGAVAHADDLCDLTLLPPPIYDHPAADVDREFLAISDVNDYCGHGTNSADKLDAVIVGCTICQFADCTEYLPEPGVDGVTVNDVACVIRHEDGHVNSERETGDPDSNHFGWM
jgi:hypothetical protein